MMINCCGNLPTNIHKHLIIRHILSIIPVKVSQLFSSVSVQNLESQNSEEFTTVKLLVMLQEIAKSLSWFKSHLSESVLNSMLLSKRCPSP